MGLFCLADGLCVCGAMCVRVLAASRKEEYERQLAEIEKDIERMSKKFVYVSLD